MCFALLLSWHDLQRKALVQKYSRVLSISRRVSCNLLRVKLSSLTMVTGLTALSQFVHGIAGIWVVHDHCLHFHIYIYIQTIFAVSLNDQYTLLIHFCIDQGETVGAVGRDKKFVLRRHVKKGDWFLKVSVPLVNRFMFQCTTAPPANL